jgi:hypothetical protein
VAEKLALAFGGTTWLKKIRPALGFHAFGDHAVAQSFADVDHGIQNRSNAGLGKDFIDEAAIHFPRVHAEFPQIAEVGAASAEIVDGQLHSDGFQAVARRSDSGDAGSHLGKGGCRAAVAQAQKIEVKTGPNR